MSAVQQETASKWVCPDCGWVYDPKVGDPEANIAPGTPFERLPDN